jgi:hypothetical protein
VKLSFLIAIVFGLALSVAATAQDSSTGQAPAQGSGGWQGQDQSIAHPLPGTVIEAGEDSYTIKTVTGEIYTVNFDLKTRIVKPEGESRGPGGRREVGNPAHLLNANDIRVGDFIAPMGEVNPETKTVEAKVIRKIDPELAMQIRERQENYNKTWLAGEVRAVSGARITLLGSMDHTPHTFVATDNTTFRRRHQPITLADIHAGDRVRVEGDVEAGTFVAASVVAVDAQSSLPTVPRTTPHPFQPPTQPPTQTPSQTPTQSPTQPK